MERGISPVLIYISSSPQNSVAYSINFTTEVLNTVCRSHGSQPVVRSFTSTEDAQLLFDSCVTPEDASLNVSCAVSLLPPLRSQRYVYSSVLQNVSILLVGKTEYSPSYVCLGSTVRYHYMFMDAEWIQKFIITDLNFALNLSILLPTKVEVISGHCEQTVHVLGRIALLFTMSSEWKEDAMSKIDHVLRYHAYTMAASASCYRMDRANPYGSIKKNSTCQVRKVLEATEIPADWRSFTLCVGLGLFIILVFSGCVFRCLAARDWHVGSRTWMFRKLISEARRKGAVLDASDLNTLLEVVEHRGDNVDDDDYSSFASFNYLHAQTKVSFKNSGQISSGATSRATSDHHGRELFHGSQSVTSTNDVIMNDMQS